MFNWTTAGPSVLASFMASLVEFVEALTIVLAVGVVRGWRSALLGVAGGVALLALLVATLGRTLAGVALPALQFVLGVLLLLFGLRWLRKAILRAAGVLPLHDEAQAYAGQTQALRGQPAPRGAALDAVALLTSFKAVVLEGLEVVFIVIALGAGGRLLVPAALGAGLALLLVVALGLLLHRPLATVPENTLKFGVGVMLTAFGTFWAGQGVGLAWPGDDAAIVALLAVDVAVGLLLVRACRRVHAGRARPARRPTGGAAPMALPVRVAREMLGLFVDDVGLALAVPACVGLAWLLAAGPAPPGAVACLAYAGALLAALGVSALRRARLSP